MIVQQTLEKLRQLRLFGMVAALEAQAQQGDVQGLSFEERLGLLVDREWTHRQDRRLSRYLKEAKLRLPACVEEVECTATRGLDRGVLRSLASCDWIRQHQNVLIEGATGVGKTFLACALANAACRQGFRARYYRVPRLLSELSLAKADGSYPQVMTRLARTHLLVLDDWGLAPLAAADGRDLLELIDDRSQTHSTVVASQLPTEHWHAAIADPTVADAILDRLVHGAHRLVLKGESMRKLAKRKNQIDHPDA